MRPTEFVLHLPEGGTSPIYLCVAAALGRAIKAGALAPGDPLPGTRALADQLGVNRKTVIAAFEELEIEGWVESRASSGTFVAALVPASWPGHWDPNLPHESPDFELMTQLTPLSETAQGVMDFRDGLPDPRLLPVDALAQAYHRALRRREGALMHVGEIQGEAGYRRAISSWLGERRGILLGPEGILSTGGSTQGLELLVRAFVKDGGVVAMERPGSPAMREAILRTGVEVLGLPVDSGGLVLESLESILGRVPIRLLYLTPHHQFPTGVTLAPERRVQLMDWAAQHRFVVVEDDGDFEFHVGARPPLPMAAQDPKGRVITLGSFSRLLAPGLRLGFIAAQPALVEKLARLRQRLDLYGDRVMERAVGDLLRGGELPRFIRKARLAYQARREHILERLSAWPGARFDRHGGLGIWIQWDGDWGMGPWLKACAARSLRLSPGTAYDPSGTLVNALRLGFGGHSKVEIDQALDLMEQLAPWRRGGG
ncbi:MAG: PLP-dependent aminotransferase family protein [Geothrix sp.]|nr:PLP-dependent aminotransferase family protein [Geothrix sp.]